MFADKLSQKGASLYLTLMILTVISALAINLGTLFISQIRGLQDIGDSVLAYYAAETGIEKALFSQLPPGSEDQQVLENQASYHLWVFAPGEGDCPAQVLNYCIKSIGQYRDVRRGLRVVR